MTVYRIETNFDTTLMRVDLTEASSPIEWADADGRDEWHGTQYQTADARHDAERAAVLVYRYLGSDHWLEPGEDYPEDEDAYINDLIISVEPAVPTKDDIRSFEWETVATYVSEFPSGDDVGATDVEVQLGEHNGFWMLRTTDDAGGSDECDDTVYDSREEAIQAAENFASEHNDAQEGEDAEDYLRRLKEEAAEEASQDADPEGEWCVYWSTSLDDAGPRERYTTREAAEAVCEVKNANLHRHNPGHLLCGFEVRHLEGRRWVQTED